MRTSERVREKVQSFVEQVCREEGWKVPKVMIPPEEEFRRYALQLVEEPVPPEAVKAISSPSLKAIIINPKYVYRTNILHELVHYNTPREEWRELIETEPPEFLHTIVELRAEAKARKLARKYREEWKKKVERNPEEESCDPWCWVVPAAIILTFVSIPVIWWTLAAEG